MCCAVECGQVHGLTQHTIYVILFKRQMLDLWQNGKFGNKLRSWPNLNSLIDSKYQGFLSIRSKRGKGNGATIYNIRRRDLAGTILQLMNENVDPNTLYFNETAPDEHLVMQGELCENWIGRWELLYSEEKCRMNEALRNGSPKNLHGLATKLYLQRVCSPSSYEDLKELLDLYPLAAIEFSVYSHNLGDCVGRNTIFWEVRNY